MLAPDAAFRDLIGRLVSQREADISTAVAALREENASLREEVVELGGGRRRSPKGACGGDADRLTLARGELSPSTAAPVVPSVPSSCWLQDELAAPAAPATRKSRNSTGRRSLSVALHSIPESPWLSFNRGGGEGSRRNSRNSAAHEAGEWSEEPRRLSTRYSDDGSPMEGAGFDSSLPPSSVSPSVMTALTTFSPVNQRRSATEVTRFSQMFHVNTWNTNAAMISAHDVLPVLEQRGLRNLSLQRVSSVMQRLSEASPSPQGDAERTSRGDHDDTTNYEMPFKVFMDTMLSTNIAKGLSGDVAEDARHWQRALMTQRIDEVIDRLAKAGSPESLATKHKWASHSSLRCSSHTGSYLSRRGRKRMLHLLNTVVAITVMLSVVSLSLSMDYCRDCEVWFYAEMIAAIIFVAELMIKLSIFGFEEFLLGDDRMWNWSDMLITMLDFLEVGMSILYRIGGQDGDRMFSVGTVLVALRSLRILRFARLVKMLRSPLLHELANILQGFMLGLPALLWVVMVIWIVLWVIGAAFRHLIGPGAGEELLTEKCGFDGDSMDDSENAVTIQMFPECGDRHRLYGDEYCSTVIGCSFTVFRCMIGDCSSKGGRSLPAQLSEGYKLRFDIVYVLANIVLIFGLFNVITAVFVESTMRGLAAQDTRIKRQEKYHVKHVKRALEKLVQRITGISETYRKTRELDEIMDSTTSPIQGLVRRVFGSAWLSPRKAFRPASPESSESSFAIDPAHLTLSEGAFNEVLRDEGVQCILDELDVNLGTDNASIFRIFKKDREGQLPLTEMLVTLMMLRGDTSKVDFIGPSVMIGGLREEVRGDVHKVQEMLLSTRQVLVSCQRQLRELAGER